MITVFHHTLMDTIKLIIDLITDSKEIVIIFCHFLTKIKYNVIRTFTLRNSTLSNLSFILSISFSFDTPDGEWRHRVYHRYFF